MLFKTFRNSKFSTPLALAILIFSSGLLPTTAAWAVSMDPTSRRFDTPAPAAQLRQKVVLLSSLNMAYVRLPFYLFFMRHYYRTYEIKLANRFRGFFAASGYDLEVRLGATQADIWQSLHDPRNVGVLWVSHAAGAAQVGPGLSSDGAIADLDGFDVTPAFQGIHPNLRFLGIVGCKSSNALFKQLQTHHALEGNPDVKVEAFDYKVDAKRGLSRMLWLAHNALSVPAVMQGYLSNCPVRKGYPLQISRHVDPTRLYVPAIRIENAGEVLGVFPAVKAVLSRAQPTDQVTTVYLEHPLGAVDPFELKLIENAGENASATTEDINLGDLVLGTPWPGASWSVFSDHSGNPVGVTSHIFRYTGIPSLSTEPVDYQPFQCEAMPALRSTYLF